MDENVLRGLMETLVSLKVYEILILCCASFVLGAWTIRKIK